MIVHGLSRMKFVAAYLLAALAGNSSPSAEDLSAILESGNQGVKSINGSFLTVSYAWFSEEKMHIC